MAQGARKGLITITGKTESQALFGRLSEHADSITAGQDLELSDFTCRYLTVDAIWIPLGESLLINMFSPIWNVIVDGFGNHDPGSGRKGQKKSQWDILHPGRAWAEKLTGIGESYDEVVARLTGTGPSKPMKNKRGAPKPNADDQLSA